MLPSLERGGYPGRHTLLCFFCTPPSLGFSKVQGFNPSPRERLDSSVGEASLLTEIPLLGVSQDILKDAVKALSPKRALCVSHLHSPSPLSWQKKLCGRWASLCSFFPVSPPFSYPGLIPSAPHHPFFAGYRWFLCCSIFKQESHAYLLNGVYLVWNREWWAAYRALP